jgi:hypothetical protein
MSGSVPTIAVGDLRVLALEGDTAPDDVGGTYEQIHAGAINDAGIVAFSASLDGASTSSAIVLLSGDSPRVLLRAGDTAPGGGFYRSFGELDLGDGGFLLFQASLDGGAASEGVFLWTPEGVQVVARTGGRSSRGGTYAAFAQLTITSCKLEAGPYYQLAFVATMGGGRRSIVLQSSYEAVAELLSTGDSLGKDMVDDLAISRLGASLSCVVDIRRSKQRRRKAILVQNGLITHGDALRERMRLPGLGKVTRLLAPPAANLQEGFVALEFECGGSGLATREVAGDSQVFVKTGDPAPGLLGVCIERFGAPGTNSGVPVPGRFGVASTVWLSNGCAALWAGVFAQQIPLTGHAIMPLIEGDSTDDERSLIVRAFTPLKLTNNGALLLRATLEGGGTTHEGLLLLDGLFDWCAQ